ncbi:MAG: hypothetical protein MJZ66_09450 [Bacteroidales bacterium]|nr:hypothetical protein [Bacteroidales bacterium]
MTTNWSTRTLPWKENPEKLLLSVNKNGVEQKDITGNQDFEVVENVEI